MRFASLLLATAVSTGLSAGVAIAGETMAPAGAKVYFQNIKDGDTISTEQVIKFGLSGMGVAPAGVEKAKTGHHHLLIDADLTDDQIEQGVYKDEQHRHFGGGQTETVIKLKPGKHTLLLVLGDHNHVPHKTPVVSKKITVTVK